MSDDASRARALVGVPFRPQGRSLAGLDCVGVIIMTFGLRSDSVRRDYRMRGDHLGEIKARLSERFRAVAKTRLRAGDVMVMRAAPAMVHLAVRTTEGFVHAHAGIGRVVETPGMPQWPVIGVYRKRKGR